MTTQEKPQKKHSIKPHNKVRTGCVTCRRRRVKCDESKPTCMRCRRGRHDCAGYNTPVAWIFDPFSHLDGDRPPDKTNPLHRSTDHQQSLTIIEFERPQINNVITTQVQTLPQRRNSRGSNPSSSARFTLTSHPSSRTASASASCSGSASTNDSSNSTSPKISQSLPHLLEWTPEEGSRFQYYMAICRTTLETALESDAELFCTILPQASHRVPAIRSALVCFASYAESLAETDPIRRQSHRQVAERQYEKVLLSAASIGGSRRSDSDWLEVFLVALLLRCIETYRHDYLRAKTHLVGSARIVTEKGGIGHFRNPALAIDNSIKHIISRVDAKVRLEAVQPDLARISPMTPFLEFNSVVSTICKRLKALREGLVYGDEDTANKMKVICQCVDELDRYFISFQNVTKSPDDKGQPSSSSIYLQVQYEICRLVLLELADEGHGTRRSLSSTSTSTSTSPSSLQSPHQHILDLIIQFADLQHPPHPHSHLDSTSPKTVHYRGKRRVYLGFGVELIPSVLFIATESPDRATRRSAISFLRSSYRQEWLWDSFNATRIAEWLTSQHEDIVDDGIDGTSQGSVDGEDGRNNADADGSNDNDHRSSLRSHSHPSSSSSSSSSSSQFQSQPHLLHRYHHPISATFHVPHTTNPSHKSTTSTSTSSSSTSPESPFHRATWIQLKLRTSGSGSGNTNTNTNTTTTHWLNSDENNFQDQVKNLEPPYPSLPRYTVPGPFWPSAAQAIWNSWNGGGGR
ncbi:hypothetical protein PV10_08384 [Exophiala mesophila]|uniref:Zn(2)-C6 fungal-type domain-containing protein n=1 Tax=Exophiala mesophila TaxID=212818 RepID=A0A0D1Z1T3_EXOME|nr:uncharacterized protein PV10_08384 [Exophiala mesophila]KIV88732.1 hypothetical protein PV10_08384 [Exophiala mesophila]